MIKKLAIAIAIGLAANIPIRSNAQQLIGSYIALLSEADHFNSKGQRLNSAAAIIRQNRANFHRFGIRSPEDQDDPFFANEANRAALEQMLERGRADAGVVERIVSGPPVLVRVDIFRGASGPFIRVTPLNNRQPAQQPSNVASQPQTQPPPPAAAPNNANGQYYRDRIHYQQRRTYRDEQSRHQRLRRNLQSNIRASWIGSAICSAA